jgi:transcriptional regulatory protein RtcR
MDKRKTVVLGFYGTTLDGGLGSKRWGRWRPTVSLCQHDDLVVDRLELIHTAPATKGATQVAEDVAQVSPETKVRLHTISLSDPWDFQEVFEALHEFARTYEFDLQNNRYLVHITTGSHVMQICWFLLTESRHFPASLIQTSPPTGKLGGVVGEYRTIDLDLSRYDRIARRFGEERAESLAFLKSGIETRNDAFNELIESIEIVALRSHEPLLLMGPTGAGKSQLCRQIYQLKRARRRIEGPLVEVNCATIRGDGAMSALFGHVKGAFTGAAKDRKGLLRTADKGVLFLDEIGELGLDEQAMLLRALEERRFLPVGTDEEVSSHFELIAGTNRDLKAAVRAGTFREDLLARINLWTFVLPSLRERKEDIEPNLEFELERAATRLGKKVTMNSEARGAFLSFATGPEGKWAANFRDFGASILRMATLAPAGRIDVPTVSIEKKRLTRAWEDDAGERLPDLLGDLAKGLDPFDRAQLAEVVRVCRASKSLSEAGRVLFAVSRTKKTSVNDADRLKKYLARFDLSWESVIRAATPQ